jgi:mannose-6-phosphate isomerase
MRSALAINYSKLETQKVYNSVSNKSNLIIDCPYFTTNFIPLEENNLLHKSRHLFTVYMCVWWFYNYL